MASVLVAVFGVRVGVQSREGEKKSARFHLANAVAGGWWPHLAERMAPAGPGGNHRGRGLPRRGLRSGQGAWIRWPELSPPAGPRLGRLSPGKARRGHRLD